MLTTTTTNDASTRSMTIALLLVLLGCSAIIMTESFSPSVMLPVVRGERTLFRTGLSTACKAATSYADLSPDPITNTNTAAAALHHAYQTSCELRSHSRRRGSTLGVPNSSPVRPGASLRSSPELNFRAGSNEPDPIPESFTESGIMASAVGYNDYYSHYYSYGMRDYDEEGDNYERYDQEEGRRGVLGSSSTGSSVLMSSLASDGAALQRWRRQQGYEFRRVDVRASRKECQDKWLQRSAAPIVDLLGLAAPLLLVASFTMGSGNVP